MPPDSDVIYIHRNSNHCESTRKPLIRNIVSDDENDNDWQSAGVRDSRNGREIHRKDDLPLSPLHHAILLQNIHKVTRLEILFVQRSLMRDPQFPHMGPEMSF